jgi:uncharacterized protein (DUF1330 family)
MTAYLIANVEIENREAYQEYVRRNTAIVAQHGGRFVARGGKCTVLEGAWTAHRVVLIEFPDAEAAHAWYQSAEYQEILPIRHKNAKSHLIAIIDGG